MVAYRAAKKLRNAESGISFMATMKLSAILSATTSSIGATGAPRTAAAANTGRSNLKNIMMKNCKDIKLNDQIISLVWREYDLYIYAAATKPNFEVNECKNLRNPNLCRSCTFLDPTMHIGS